MTEEQTRTALIDGDIVVYRVCFAAQAQKGGMQLATLICDKFVNEILTKIGACDYELYLTATDKSNYRYQIAKRKEYKGSAWRLKQEKPEYYNDIREHLQKVWKAEVVTGIEADDMLGIRQCKLDDSCIVTMDKDLDMIPGHHYNPVSRRHYLTTDEDKLKLIKDNKKLIGGGHRWLYAQMLLGDMVDNIEGLKGYGCVKTYKALNEPETEKDLIKATLGLYRDAYGRKGKEYFLENLDLLWIQRNEDERKSELIADLI